MNVLTFVELADMNDDLLLPWLDLYETAFPPSEKVPVSCFLSLLKEKARGLRPYAHILAAIDDAGRLVGLARFDDLREPGIAYLWYLAVAPDARGRGLGGALHDEVLRRCREAGARAAVMEVEIPEESDDPEFARKRIEFYTRHGAKLLRGIRYVHSVGSTQPEILMHIMVRPFDPITPEEALGFAQALFGEDAVTRVGELELE